MFTCGKIKRSDVWMLGYPSFLPSGSACLRKRGEWGKVYWPTASPQFWGSVRRSSHRCVCRGAWGSITTQTGLNPVPLRWKPGMHCSTRTAREHSPPSQRGRWQICGTFYGSGSWTSCRLGLCSALPCLPCNSLLSRSDRLAPSRPHLWWSVHLLWATIPPRDFMTHSHSQVPE